MRQYLLGELSTEAQRQLEERAMTDADSFEQLLLVEDELVDEYVCGVLTPSERARFDNILSTPERHQSSASPSPFEDTSQRHQRQLLNARSHPQGAAERFAMAAPAISRCRLASGPGVVFGHRIHGHHSFGPMVRDASPAARTPAHSDSDLGEQLIEERSRRSQLAARTPERASRRTSLEQQLASLNTTAGREPEGSRQPGALTPTLVSFALAPGLVRDLQGSRRVTIPPGASWVQLELDWVGDEYKGYQAAL